MIKMLLWLQIIPWDPLSWLHYEKRSSLNNLCQCIAIALGIQNVEKYQMSEIRFFPFRGWKMNQWQGFLAYFYSTTFHTKSGDKIWTLYTCVFKTAITYTFRTWMGQLNCWKIPIVRNSTFCHWAKTVNACVFLFWWTQTTSP